jgi:dTDP-4-dehydrorhamnose 3,5-epimerase
VIDGVVIKPLRQVLDERGKIMHMLRKDDPDFEAFGEIYFSVVYPGATPRVWNGFKGIGTAPSIVANCSTIPHQPDEIERLDPHSSSIPYRWERVDR